MAELDWAAKLSLTVGLCAGRLGSTSGWGDGELQMCAYLSYAREKWNREHYMTLLALIAEAADSASQILEGAAEWFLRVGERN